MNKTKVIRCNCKHEFQDKTYGEGMRVHILKQKDAQQGNWACTVCGLINQHHVREEEVKETKGKKKK